MPRTPLIAANWKMNTTLAEAKELARNVVGFIADVTGVDKVLCPPFISIGAVAKAAAGTSVMVGAQNMYFEEQGSFTGEVSALMLKDLCRYVILGHSERRSFFRETDEAVARKALVAQVNGIQPIICVGETAHERQSDRAVGVVAAQVRQGISRISFDPGMVVAYEPVWAVGSGLPASPEIANEMCGLIRKELGAKFGSENAEAVRILYGGSVTSKNIGDFVSRRQIDGALVGGASLQAEEFAAIVRNTASAARAV
ncbi:MAG: triose-phosphate isomerase [Dehalococcoidia bacterium]|nr:triose-phosphate isomerase [Dehalococcoidia bacterium]